MNFKDSYKNDNGKITPDPEFQKNLIKQAEALQQSEIKRRKKISISVKICSSCAAVLVLITGISLYVRNSSGTQKIQPGEKAGKNNSASVSTGMLTQKCWYDSDMSDEQIYTLLIDRLNDKNDLDCLYKNSQNMFDDENIIDQSSIKELTDKISKARPCDDTPDDKSNIIYYMAQFKNSDIIKFSVYDDEYVKIKNVDGFFKF